MVEIITPSEDDPEDLEFLGYHTVVSGGKRKPRAVVPMKILTYLGVTGGDSLTWLTSREETDKGVRNTIKLVKR